MNIFLWTIQIIAVPGLSPLCIGIIRKMKAKLQNRKGAGVFQPYRELVKLLYKDEVESRDASWIFRSAPWIVFGITLVVGASIPLFTSLLRNALTGDLLLVVYALSIGTFFLALAGMDTGSGFGGFGASREMTIAALAEGGVIFSLVTVALINGTTNLFAISGGAFDGGLFLSSALAFCGFFIVMLAETARFPFDNPATHLELTMIHESMILEYSGKKLALMEWAAANKMLIFIALGANLFFPWGMAHGAAPWSIIVSMAVFLAKIFVFCAAIAIIESSIAKFRFFRLPDLLVVSFVLNIVALSIIYL